MTRPPPSSHDQLDRFSQALGRSRYAVILAVLAVMLVALSLFLIGTFQAGVTTWHAWRDLAQGSFQSATTTVEFLEIVTVMLKAVVFYLVGVGLYSLFIRPLNITMSLGVQTLNDLETKVVSVVIVILSVTFLEHFILWKDPTSTLQFGAALALVVAALVFFQRYSHAAKEDQRAHHPDEQSQAQRAMIEEEDERAAIGHADERPRAERDEQR
jgi:uncharacterized membrane protein YqhA